MRGWSIPVACRSPARGPCSLGTRAADGRARTGAAHPAPQPRSAAAYTCMRMCFACACACACACARACACACAMCACARACLVSAEPIHSSMPARRESSVSRPGSPERLRRAAGWKRRALKSAGARCMARCTARCVACLGLGSVVGVSGQGQWSGSVVRASGQGQACGALRRLLASHLELRARVRVRVRVRVRAASPAGKPSGSCEWR